MNWPRRAEVGETEEVAAARRASKSASAFRTIGEVAEDLDLPPHVLRFWESKFPQLKPLKRGGGRRYYRPEDVLLLRRIRKCLYQDGYTIKGVQKLLREGGLRADNGGPASAEMPLAEPMIAEPPRSEPPQPKTLIEVETQSAEHAAGTGLLGSTTLFPLASDDMPTQTRGAPGAVNDEAPAIPAPKPVRRALPREARVKLEELREELLSARELLTALIERRKIG